MRLIFAIGLITLSMSAFASSEKPWPKTPSKAFQPKPFPVIGSAAHNQDFKILHAEQINRDENECKLARRMLHPTYLQLFQPIDDTVLKDSDLKAVQPLLERVIKLVERITTYHKKKFARARPFITDKNITPCVPKHHFGGGMTSYPSSHASTSAAAACILAKLYPSQSSAIIEYGDRLGFLRVEIGVHHPSDVSAGQELGKEVCETLFSKKDFRKDFAEAKKSVN